MCSRWLSDAMKYCSPTTWDFGDLIRYPPGNHCGVILLRIRPETENEVHALLPRVLADFGKEQLRGRLLVIDRNKCRVRASLLDGIDLRDSSVQVSNSQDFRVPNKARVALERALRNPPNRVLGVHRGSKCTLGFLPTGVIVGRAFHIARMIDLSPDLSGGGRSHIIENVMTAEQKSTLAGVATIDKEVMHGTPCFAHTRVPVQTLIDFLETGETIGEYSSRVPRHYPATRFLVSRTKPRNCN
jgi:uncharacterized protein (DUF433 family)